MLLKYTGPKEIKTIEYNGLTLVFMAIEGEGGPKVCEIKDPATLKFLLGADMKGLFASATSGVSKDLKAENKVIATLREASEELTKENEALEKANDLLEDENKTLKKEIKELSKKLKEKK